MRRILNVMILLVVHVVFAHAQQTDADALHSMLAENCVLMEADYKITMSQTRIEGKAVIEAQGNAYVMKTEGMQVYCDGETMWTVDSESKEVYIEPALAEGQQGLDNALVALLNSDALECTFSDDGKLSCMAVSFQDGTTVSADVLSFAICNKKSVTSYRPQFEFGSDWIVTDLR